MKITQLFSQTRRGVSACITNKSHQLLLKSGLIWQLRNNFFTLLPLAVRVLRKIEAIIREELAVLNGQEIRMPFIQPTIIWQQSGRGYSKAVVASKLMDLAGEALMPAPGYEEILLMVVESKIHSYRQLPANLFQFHSVWRDSVTPYIGLLATRENYMFSGFSCHTDKKDLDTAICNYQQLFENVFNRCQIPVISVLSDAGWHNGDKATDWVYLTEDGPEKILVCENCDYAAHQDVARFKTPTPTEEVPLPLEKVATPNTKTIEAVAEYLNVPSTKTAKAVFMIATVPEEDAVRKKFVFAVVRGDMEVNEIKLANAIQALALRPATEDEIHQVRAVPGYASPIGLKNVLVVVDSLIPYSPNLVTGANAEGFHYINSNFGRDYRSKIVADIVTAHDGDICMKCGGKLHLKTGAMLGRIYNSGSALSKKIGFKYPDAAGNARPVLLGIYELNCTRLLAGVVAENNDEFGIIWPVHLAPFQVHLIVLGGKSADPEILKQADMLHEKLKAAGLEVLFDDRPESPGVKFNDADLLGIPVRLTMSQRALEQGGVEFKRRDRREKEIIPFDDILDKIHSEIVALEADTAQRIILKKRGSIS